MGADFLGLFSKAWICGGWLTAIFSRRLPTSIAAKPRARKQGWEVGYKMFVGRLLQIETKSKMHNQLHHTVYISL